MQGLEKTFDTALCLNVLEYVDDPAAVLAALHAALGAGGVLLVLVPQGPGLFAGASTARSATSGASGRHELARARLGRRTSRSSGSTS